MDFKRDIGDRKTDCYEIDFGFDDYEIFSLCEGANNNHFQNIVIKKVPCDQNCTYSFDIKINGKSVRYSIKDDGNYYFNLQKYLDSYKNFLIKGQLITVQIIIRKDCPGLLGSAGGTTYESETFQTIQVIGKGTKYSVFEDVGIDYPDNYAPCDEARENGLFEKYLTCCDSKKREVHYTTINSTISHDGHDGTITLRVTGGFSAGITGSIGFSKSYYLPYLEKYINESFSSDCSVELEGKSDGKCEYPAITTTFRHVKEYIYIEDCDESTIELPVDEIDHYYPMNFCLRKCTEYAEGCPPLDGKLHENRENKILVRENCSSNIIMEIYNPEKIYTYTWILPDGSQYEGDNEIMADQPGLYKCIVKDECCNEKEFQYNNCNQFSYSDWYYDNGQYCTTVTCNCNDIASREDNTYTMCVTPQRYDAEWSFDETRKKCTKHAYWTDQDGLEIDLTDEVGEDDIDAGDENVVKEPVVEDHYDNNTNQCVRDYYCETGGIGYDHIVKPPTNYGLNWNFENYDNTCHREVYCFNEFEAVDEDQIIPAEISWTFNLSSGMCDGTVYCDGTEQFGAYVPSHYPYDEDDWVLYTPDNHHCKKNVECEFGESEEVIAKMKITAVNDDTCPENEPIHVIWYCNDEFIGDECQSAGRAKDLLNNSNYSNKSIDKIKGLLTIYPNPYQKNINITIVSEKNTMLNIDLITMTGKKVFSKTKNITKGENSFSLNDFKGINKGMYFIHLYDDKDISYTYKLIKE